MPKSSDWIRNLPLEQVVQAFLKPRKRRTIGKKISMDELETFKISLAT